MNNRAQKPAVPREAGPIGPRDVGAREARRLAPAALRQRSRFSHSRGGEVEQFLVSAIAKCYYAAVGGDPAMYVSSGNIVRQEDSRAQSDTNCNGHDHLDSLG